MKKPGEPLVEYKDYKARWALVVRQVGGEGLVHHRHWQRPAFACLDCMSEVLNPQRRR